MGDRPFVPVGLRAYLPLVVLGGSVSSPRRLLFAWGATRFPGPTHKASEVPGLNELFYFVFQGLAFFGGVAGILVVPAPFAAVGVFWAQGPSGRWYQLGT